MTISLTVTERDQKQKVEALREAGSVPVNVYGPKQEPVSISAEKKELVKVLEQAGESTIIELKGLKEPIEVLVHDVDFDPVKSAILHVDFYAIERGKEMTTNVALEFIGESPAEENNIGSVTKVLHEVEVTCMPSALPSHIDVDISSMEDEHSKITIADLKVPEGVKIENDQEETVAVVSLAREEEEEESTEIDMDAIEVEGKGKEATEEGESSTEED